MLLIAEPSVQCEHDLIPFVKKAAHCIKWKVTCSLLIAFSHQGIDVAFQAARREEGSATKSHVRVVVVFLLVVVVEARTRTFPSPQTQRKPGCFGQHRKSGEKSCVSQQTRLRVPENWMPSHNPAQHAGAVSRPERSLKRIVRTMVLLSAGRSPRDQKKSSSRETQH